MSKAPKDLRIPIMMSSAEVGAIDDWRFTSKIATRAEAVRRLCQVGLYLDKTNQHIFDLFSKAQGDKELKADHELKSAIIRSAVVLVMLRGMKPEDTGDESPAEVANQIFESLKDDDFSKQVAQMMKEELEKRRKLKQV